MSSTLTTDPPNADSTSTQQAPSAAQRDTTPSSPSVADDILSPSHDSTGQGAGVVEAKIARTNRSKGEGKKGIKRRSPDGEFDQGEPENGQQIKAAKMSEGDSIGEREIAKSERKAKDNECSQSLTPSKTQNEEHKENEEGEEGEKSKNSPKQVHFDTLADQADVAVEDTDMVSGEEEEPPSDEVEEFDPTLPVNRLP